MIHSVIAMLAAVLFLGLVIFLVAKAISGGKISVDFESPEKRAGRYGERFASQVISEVLKDGDVLLTNVRLSADGKQAELDNVIINNRGVFIIEVKNYTGELYGEEDDQEWIKNKITPHGSFYQQTIRNPIKQVNRQIYITSQYLKNYGINVWVEGYVFFVEMNSPVESDKVLVTQRDIDNAIHCGYNNILRTEESERIVELLSATSATLLRGSKSELVFDKNMCYNHHAGRQKVMIGGSMNHGREGYYREGIGRSGGCICRYCQCPFV